MPLLQQQLTQKTELFGLVVVEAMACGTPVIVSSAGPLPELVINGDNGYVFEDRNVADLSNKINKIISKSEVVEKMGLKSRKLAENKYNWNNIAKKVREIYKKTL